MAPWWRDRRESNPVPTSVLALFYLGTVMAIATILSFLRG